MLALHAELARIPAGSAGGPSTDALERSAWPIGPTTRSAASRRGCSSGSASASRCSASPSSILLDEPTSALDPVGRIDVRAIVRAARDRGATVILNSHLLTEVERVCDRVVILDHGRAIASGTARRGGRRGRGPAPRDRARRRRPGGRRCVRSRSTVDGEWLTIRPLAADRIPDLVAAVVAAGGRVHAVDPGRGSLEARFLELLAESAERPIVIVIARLTVAELVRRRVVWVLAILTLVSVDPRRPGASTGSSTLRATAGPSSSTIQIGVSQVLILIAFMFSFVLAMTAAFIGAPAIGGDLESGVAAAILARPLRRAEILLGRWLGCALVVAAYAAASGLLAIVVTALVSGYGPPEPLLAVAFLAGEALVLLTLTLALGSVLPSIAAGAIAVVGFGLGWMAGVLAGVATALGVTALDHGRRDQPLAAPDRRPVARRDLWARAAARRPDRRRPRTRPRQRQPVLRRDAAAARVRGLVDRLDRARARRGDLVVRATRPVIRAVGQPAVAEAARQVVVDQPDALHERVDDGRADEPEPAPLAGPPTARPRPASWPGSGRRPPSAAGGAGGGGTIVARYASNEPNSAAVASSATALPIVASILAPLRTIPASAISRARSSVIERGHDGADRSRGTPPGMPSRLRRIVDHDRPAWNDSRASRSNSSASSWTGVAPLVVVVGDHQRVGVRAVGAGPGAARSWLDHAAPR